MRFFLIDKINEWNVGATAKATKNVALSKNFFDDHFPRRPVMLGVLIIKGMAQLSGLLAEASLKEKYRQDAKAVLTVPERIKFRELVRTGETLTYCTDVISVNKTGGKVLVQALCGNRTVVISGMVFAFKYVNDPMLEDNHYSRHQM